MRRALLRLLLAGPLLLALTIVQGRAAGGAAGGGDQPQAVRAELDAGLDGYFVPGRPVPVRVTLTATELTSGELLVRLGGSAVEVVEVEVTAGSSEDHWMVLDAPMGDGVQVFASLRIDGEQRQADTQALRYDPDTHLLGVLPSLGTGRASDDLPMANFGQDIHFVPLTPELLDLGPNALAGLDSIAVLPDDIAALSDRHRSALLGWLNQGGTLYVDGPASPLIDWPEELSPGAPAVGATRVVATEGALAAGRWADVVLPAANRSIHEDADASQNVPGPDLFFELSGVDLGRDLPPLGRLLAILGIYILVVGPVVYLASKKRVMLRWVAIPAVAALATGFLAVTGEGLGSDTSVSVVDVIETGPGAAIATSRVLVSTEAGAGRAIAAPAGWSAENDDNFGFGSQVTQRRTAGGVTLGLSTQAGGVSYATARGPVDFQGALEVHALATDEGVVRGEIVNTTEHDLHDVAVFAGRASGVAVGPLAAGDSVAFELTGTNQFRFQSRVLQDVWAGVGSAGSDGGPAVATTLAPPVPIVPDEFVGEIVSETCDQFGNCEQCDANGNCFGFGGEVGMTCDEFGNCFPDGGCGSPTSCSGRLPRPESLGAALWDRGSNAMTPGLITAVGWSDRIDPVLDLGSGISVVERRTAIVGRGVPVAAGDRLTDSGVVRQLASVTSDQNGNIVILFRFDLPATVGDRPVDPNRLRIDVPTIFTRVSIIQPGSETVLRDVQFGEAPPADRIDAAVPPGAVMRNSVFVEATLPFAPPRPGRELVIYEAAA